ncbi:hypothetical protein FPV67DRAFT_1447699 [Lyophyllum atratum]|nr:hypothetical protein FPV67DRAFT_1447699 [Lyophyllum atratum]
MDHRSTLSSTSPAASFDQYLDVIAAQIKTEAEEWLEEALDRIVAHLVQQLDKLADALTDPDLRPSWLETSPGEPLCYTMFTPDLPQYTNRYWTQLKVVLISFLEEGGFHPKITLLPGKCFKIVISFPVSETSDQLYFPKTLETDDLPYFPTSSPFEEFGPVENRFLKGLLEIHLSRRKAEGVMENSPPLTLNHDIPLVQNISIAYLPADEIFSSSQNTSITDIDPSLASEDHRHHFSTRVAKSPTPAPTTNFFHPRGREIWIPESDDPGQRHRFSIRVGTSPPIVVTAEPLTPTAVEKVDGNSKQIFAHQDVETGITSTRISRIPRWLVLLVMVVVLHVHICSWTIPQQGTY